MIKYNKEVIILEIYERQVINLEFARSELKKQHKALIREANGLFIVMLLIACMVQFFASAIGDKSYWQVIIWVVTMFPCVCTYVFVLERGYIIKKEYFGIVEDRLVKIERFKINWFARRDSAKDVFHFERCGKLVKYDLDTMPYASEGDEFYLLIIQSGKIKIEKAYSKKLYRLEE